MMTWSIRTGESGPDVNDILDPHGPSAFKARHAGATRYGLTALATFIEALVSRRGLAVLFFLVAALLATAGWLRPPLSPDFLGTQIPLGLWQSEAAEELLAGPRWTAQDGIGIILLALLVSGTAVVMWRPARLGRVAGLVLAMSVAGNAAAALNHPALVELMDLEYEQRRQIVESVNIPTMQEDPMATRDNGRIGATGALEGDEQRGDPVRGWVYLLHGRWLIPWAMVGILFGTSGALARRLRHACCWAVVGGALAGVVCGRRLAAECYWAQAVRSEGAGDADASGQALRTAVSLFPDFDRLERTWLLAGKLDHRHGRSTPREEFFRAYQFARERGRPWAAASAHAFPWTIQRTADYREGLVSPLAGFDRNLSPGAVGSGTEDNRTGYYRPDAPAFGGDAATIRNLELAWAAALSTDLLANANSRAPPVWNQAARIWADIGMMYYQKGALFKDTGRVAFQDSQCLGVAEEAWRQAFTVAPQNRYSQFFLGMARSARQPDHPEWTESAFRPFLDNTADKPLQADILSNVGDAYFRAGRFGEARRRYAESFDLYNMPQLDRINYRAQRRLGGL
jgi:tetratricopeptide (TPR) repeat protein